MPDAPRFSTEENATTPPTRGAPGRGASPRRVAQFAGFVVAVLVAAGLGAAVTMASASQHPAAMVASPPSAAPAPIANSTTPPPAAQGAAWAFVTRVSAPAVPTDAGTVTVMLSQADPRANDSAASHVFELYGFGWNFLNLTPKPGESMLQALNESATQSPDIVHVLAAASRSGDGAALTVKPYYGIETVLAISLDSGDFVCISWPTGVAFHWDAHGGVWQRTDAPRFVASAPGAS